MRKSQKTASRPKWSCIDVDLIKVNDLYAFSFNPLTQPEHNGYSEKIDSFAKFDRNMTTLLGGMKYANVNVFMELSKNGRLHYHGYISISDVINFFYYDIQRLQQSGTYEIDYSDDKWEKYIHKLPIMKEWCLKKGLTYNIDTIKQGKYVPAIKVDKIEIGVDMFDEFSDDQTED